MNNAPWATFGVDLWCLKVSWSGFSMRHRIVEDIYEEARCVGGVLSDDVDFWQ
jgi:hypothetical protein